MLHKVPILASVSRAVPVDASRVSCEVSTVSLSWALYFCLCSLARLSAKHFTFTESVRPLRATLALMGFYFFGFHFSPSLFEQVFWGWVASGAAKIETSAT